jgi:hypothetical protein
LAGGQSGPMGEWGQRRNHEQSLEEMRERE